MPLVGTLAVLACTGEIDSSVVEAAIRDFDIDPKPSTPPSMTGAPSESSSIVRPNALAGSGTVVPTDACRRSEFLALSSQH